MTETFIGAVIAGVAIYFVTTLGVTALQVVALLAVGQLFSAGCVTITFGLTKWMKKQERLRATEAKYIPPQKSRYQKPNQHRPRSTVFSS